MPLHKIQLYLAILTVSLFACKSGNEIPVIEILEPLDNSVFALNDTVQIKIASSDEDGEVVSLKTYWDGTEIKNIINPLDIETFQYNDLAEYVDHKIRVVAEDNDGGSNEAEISITIDDSNKYLQAWKGDYSGEMSICWCTIDGDSLRNTSVDIGIEPSELDSAIDLTMKYDGMIRVKRFLHISELGKHSSSSGMGSNFSSLTFEFSGDTLTYRASYSQGLCCRLLL